MHVRTELEFHNMYGAITFAWLLAPQCPGVLGGEELLNISYVRFCIKE